MTLSSYAPQAVLARGVLTVGRVGAGTGCKYLTGQVASGKDDFAELSPSQALTYYSDPQARGESAGRWLGRGLPTVGLAGAVSATELDNLVGHARHPHFDELLHARALRLLNDRSMSSAQRRDALSRAEKDLYLGRAFATYESAADRAQRAVAELGDDTDEASKDALRARVLADGDRQAVAAYELTFTPVKSVSVLAAIGGEPIWRQVMDAHRAAVDQALEYVQDHAAYSRAGVNGLRQIDTQGLIIAAFEHRMSREQDPNIHTHAIVANRVRCTDGRWRTVDGRAVYAASVGARAVYEQALELELAKRLGVRFSLEQRHTIREIHGIPREVIEHFSTRRAAIEQALAETVDGEMTSRDGWRRLARRFTLSTRPDKSGPESSADAIARWQRELTDAGYDPQTLLAAATHPPTRRDGARTDQQILADAIAVLTQTRAVWTRHHAVLAVSRVLPPTPGQPFTEHQQRVEQLVARLLADAVQVTPPEVLPVGVTLQRESDRGSVFTAHADVLYAARSTVAAEQRILAALTDADAPLMTVTELAPSATRHQLGDDQLAAVYEVLTAGARISAIVGPAGSGKTYVQRAIAGAWSSRTVDADHPGARDILALAPSQIAASVLADSVGARAENIAKWLHEHRHQTTRAVDATARHRSYEPDGAWILRPGQLVILDEAGMVTTRELDAILTAVRRAGAKLLLVGDDKQLGPIGAGGLFRTIVERTNAPVLSTVRRFRDAPAPGEPEGRLRDWECAASLGLRNRDLDAIAEYERRGRIHSGPLARMEQASYRAWLTDHLTFEHARQQDATGVGGVALLMADTEAAAAALSARARAELVRRGLVEHNGAPLADGNHAGVGDLIVTRLNERRIRAHDGDGFVANRDTWRVTDRAPDGSLTVAAVTGDHRGLPLPAAYASANVQLAYAGTVHSAQGRTVTTARGLITDTTSAEALYVMMTRGQLSNDAYVVTDNTGSRTEHEPHQRWPEQHHLSILAGILDRDNQPSASATDVHRDLAEQASSISRLRIIFGDLSTVIRGTGYAALIAEHAGRAAADRAVTDPAWATLVRALGAAQTLGWDSRHLLIQALTQREVGTAADVAAVLHWRCGTITGHWQQPPGAAPAGGLTWQQRAAAILDATRADIGSERSSDRGSADAADALRQTADAMDHRADQLARRLAEHAATGQRGGYDAGTSPRWLRELGPVPTAGADVDARRQAWMGHARAVAVYHDATGYEPTSQDPIGPRPPAGDAEARELWSAARTALAEAPIAATLRAMLPDRLHSWVTDALEAETHDQPSYVGHDLRDLSLRARAQRTRVTRLRQELTTAAGHLSTASRRRWRRDETAIVSLQRTHDQAAARLDHGHTTLTDIERNLRQVSAMHAAWQDWEQTSRDVRSRGRLAAQELSLRGLDPAHVSPSPADAALAPDVIAALMQEQYTIQAAATDWFRAQLTTRWAASYLTSRGLSEPANAAMAGYAPSRPGHWTLLLDHLRQLGYSDTAIETAGLATRTRRGQLIDRFRDRIVLPILDQHSRPIGFLGRKPAGDTDPDNPKYLNPTHTPLYDKSRVLYGLDADAITQLAAGARAIIVEGPMDHLAIRLAAPHLVPLATCGTTLTDAHLDLLAHYTSLDRVALGFDNDEAGRKASLAAGRKLLSRGIPAPAIQLFTPPAGADPADILATHGPTRLAATLADNDHQSTLLDLLIDQHLDHYDWSLTATPLRDLPIAEHAANETIKLLGNHILDANGLAADTVTEQSHRQILRIAERSGVATPRLWKELTNVVTRDLEDDTHEYLPMEALDEAGPEAPEHVALQAASDLDDDPHLEPDHKI